MAGAEPSQLKPNATPVCWQAIPAAFRSLNWTCCLAAHAGYLSAKSCATGRNVADVWPQSDYMGFQYFEIHPAATGSNRSILGQPVRLLNLGRAATPSCDAFLVSMAGACSGTGVALAKPDTSPVALWVVEDAGEPGVVYLRNQVRRCCGLQAQCNVSQNTVALDRRYWRVCCRPTSPALHATLAQARRTAANPGRSCSARLLRMGLSSGS